MMSMLYVLIQKKNYRTVSHFKWINDHIDNGDDSVKLSYINKRNINLYIIYSQLRIIYICGMNNIIDNTIMHKLYLTW